MNTATNTAEILDSMEAYKVFKVIDCIGNTLRAKKYSETQFFVYAPRKKRRGWYKTKDEICQFYTIVPEKEDNRDKIWHKHIRKAIKCLEGSGLWASEDLIGYLKNLDKMKLEDKEAILKAYWSQTWKDIPDSERALENEKLYGKEMMEKYPFVFPNPSGEPDTSYLWEKSDVKLKKMYFGKYSSELRHIAEALRNKTKYYTGRVTVQYDHSFEYNPERNMAWYSEEYRNCGNGHYYIAIDHEYAWFIETD